MALKIRNDFFELQERIGILRRKNASFSKTLKNAVVADYYLPKMLDRAPSGLSGRDSSFRRPQTYDNASRLTQIKQTGGAGVFSTVDYTLNNVGNRTVKAITGTGLGALNLTENYSYDAVDQVTGVNSSANTQTFAYDAVGNRTTVGATAPAPGVGPYTTNALNQYTALGAEVLLYDTLGNLTSKGLSAGYSYDSKNRLLSATVSGNTASIAYDYRNRPVSRTINGITTYFVYDGWNLIAEYNSGGAAPLAEYVHGAGIDEILFKHDSIHGSVFYHQDGLGSTTHLTDVLGMVVESYRYDVFGAVSITDQLGGALTASFYGNRFLFTGREWIGEIGLYDYRNRIYSPELGRFLQADPIRFDAGDVNMYRYCGNSSTILIDPSGMCSDDYSTLFAFFEGLGFGAQATVDGLLPFSDPFAQTKELFPELNIYNPEDYQLSALLGEGAFFTLNAAGLVEALGARAIAAETEAIGSVFKTQAALESAEVEVALAQGQRGLVQELVSQGNFSPNGLEARAADKVVGLAAEAYGEAKTAAVVAKSVYQKAAAKTASFLGF